MKNIIFTVTKNLIITLSATFILWGFLSWGDIVAHNDPVSGSYTCPKDCISFRKGNKKPSAPVGFQLSQMHK